jgi:hypothetical protein
MGITMNAYENGTGSVGTGNRFFAARGTAAAPAALQNNDVIAAIAGSGYWTGKANPYFVPSDSRVGISFYTTEAWSSASNNGTAISFNTTSNGGNLATERMRINQNGNIGIGTPLPSEALEVIGNVKAASYLVTSDERLKKDIITLPDSLAKVLQLRGVNFVWKSNDEKTVGFIAQEVEKIYPELVKTDKISGYKAVQYGNIVAILVEALKQEHSERVQAQRNISSVQESSQSRLNNLEKENQDLKARLERLEKILSEK